MRELQERVEELKQQRDRARAKILNAMKLGDEQSQKERAGGVNTSVGDFDDTSRVLGTAIALLEASPPSNRHGDAVGGAWSEREREGGGGTQPALRYAGGSFISLCEVPGRCCGRCARPSACRCSRRLKNSTALKRLDVAEGGGAHAQPEDRGGSVNYPSALKMKRLGEHTSPPP